MTKGKMMKTAAQIITFHSLIDHVKIMLILPEQDVHIILCWCLLLLSIFNCGIHNKRLKYDSIAFLNLDAMNKTYVTYK